MPARKKKSMQAKRKNAPKPCTDVNQHNRERIAEKNRQRDAIIKKLAEARAQEMLARQQRAAITGDNGSSATISALGNAEDSLM